MEAQRQQAWVALLRLVRQTQLWGRFLQSLDQTRVVLVALQEPLLWARYVQAVVVPVAVLQLVMALAPLKPAQGDLQC
jgi:hypothetical protein